MTTPPPTALPDDPELRPDQIKDAPYYWPNLIAALAAAIGVAVESIGPWIAFMGISRNNIGEARTEPSPSSWNHRRLVPLRAAELRPHPGALKRMIGLGTVAGIAGVLAFLIGVIDAQEVSSRKTEILGKTIGPKSAGDCG